MRSTMQLSLARLRKYGYKAEDSEKWIAFGGGGKKGQSKEGKKGMTGVRKDLFGLFDIIAFRRGIMGCLGVQTTATSSISTHTKRYLEDPDRKYHAILRDWFSCGNRFEVWGWSLKGPRGKRKLLMPNDWTFTIMKGEFMFLDASEMPDHA